MEKDRCVRWWCARSKCTHIELSDGIIRYYGASAISVPDVIDMSETSRSPFPSDRALAELGLFFGLLSIAGVGVPMIWPERRAIGILFFVIGIAGCVVVATFSLIRIVRSKRARLGTILTSIGTILLIAGTIIGLIGAFQIDHPKKISTHEAPNPLAGLNNAQLRERTIAFAQSLRELEDRYQSAQRTASYQSWVRLQSISDPDQKKTEWNAENEREMALSDQMEKEFRNKCRSDGLILRDELRKRLGSLPMPMPPAQLVAGRIIHYDTQIFDKPFLTGPAPLSGGADLLEYWAKMLP